MNSITIKDNFPLDDYSTFGISGSAKKFAHLRNKDELPDLASLAHSTDLPVLPLGSGSNTVFSETMVNAICISVEFSGIDIRQKDSEVLIRAQAAEIWDDVVAKSVSAGYSGLEALSGIPGTIGAAPVQNIGAYGQELSNVLESVVVYDLKRKGFRTLTPEACEFGYRDSIFKKQPGRFIITDITMRLTTGASKIPDYGSVRDNFKDDREHAPPADIREVIMNIRESKLPNPRQTPNVGSFFKNPVLKKSHARQIQQNYPDIPQYEHEEKIKVAAGWLIDTLGFKSRWLNTIGVHKDNALILVSERQADYSDLKRLVKDIRLAVKDEFDIDLEIEPNVYGTGALSQK